jgi:hypothetical protein
MGEHVFEREQWAGQDRKENSFSRRFVFCSSQALRPKTLDLILDSAASHEGQFGAASAQSPKL